MKSIRFVDFEVLIKEILMLDKNISLEKLNLFEIGLNSLQTMRIVNRLKQMGIVISFAELMEKPYIEKWWEILSERMSLEDALSSKILISKESNSLTDVQYAYWIGRGEKQILYDAALAAYGYDIKKRMEKLRMKVVIMYGGNELFAAKSVSLVKEKCVSECEVYAYDNMGHSEVLSLHPEKLCEIIRK